MKFVAAHDVADGADRIVRQQPRLAIAEMKLSLGEACGVAEQADHRVANALSIFETSPSTM